MWILRNNIATWRRWERRWSSNWRKKNTHPQLSKYLWSALSSVLICHVFLSADECHTKEHWTGSFLENDIRLEVRLSGYFCAWWLSGVTCSRMTRVEKNRYEVPWWQCKNLVQEIPRNLIKLLNCGHDFVICTNVGTTIHDGKENEALVFSSWNWFFGPAISLLRLVSDGCLLIRTCVGKFACQRNTHTLVFSFQ